MIHPKAEQLLQAQLQFIIQELQSEQTLTTEVMATVNHLSGRTIEQLVGLETLQRLISQQALDYPLQSRLLEQIVEQIKFALEHPDNSKVTLADLIPADSVEEVAKYLSEQKGHREAFIHRIFKNPAYAQMLSQTISHAITDYMENNVLAKKMPGVGGLMKLGKSVIERATDSNLDEALQNYLNKNINNLIGVSEKMANRHLSDEQVYQLIQQGWQRISKQPLGAVKQYIDMQYLDSSAKLAGHTWDKIRASSYLRDQINDGVAHWYAANKHQTLGTILNDVNVQPELIERELKQIAMPVIKHLIDEGYVTKRVEALLRNFYSSDAVNMILAD